jgi:hypothetical protein
MINGVIVEPAGNSPYMQCQLLMRILRQYILVCSTTNQLSTSRRIGDLYGFHLNRLALVEIEDGSRKLGYRVVPEHIRWDLDARARAAQEPLGFRPHPGDHRENQ